MLLGKQILFVKTRKCR